MAKRKRLYQFGVYNPTSKYPLYVWESSFADVEKWVRGEFKRTKSSKHIDVIRLDKHGNITNFAYRYYRDMSRKII